MGQKIHPTGYRIGTIEPWASRWHGGKRSFARLLLQDKKIREHVMKEYGSAGIPRIEIERTGEAVNVIIYTARPGVLVGRKGVRIDQLKAELQTIAEMTVHLTIHEVKRPELSAGLVAEVVADQLRRRMAFRRAVKKAVQTTIQAGALGVKVQISGRLGGAEMARTLSEREGRVPLSTLQSNVEYGLAEARTTYGIIGVKVWIYKGEIDRGQKVNYRVASAAGGRYERGGGGGGGRGGPGGGRGGPGGGRGGPAGGRGRGGPGPGGGGGGRGRGGPQGN
jgi:small subunit ribosomal protein S3